MKRQYLINELVKWKTQIKRKPLILSGARQVGKTWLAKSFGAEYFSNVVYFNFETEDILHQIFEQNKNTDAILVQLEILANQKIEAGSTLLVLDEIQRCPTALTALKYFYENAPAYHIIVAGSLLGLSLHSDAAFPVGKVQFINVYPFSYIEFLEATNETQLAELVRNKNWETITVFKEKFIALYRLYLYLGGMPEVLQTYIDTEDLVQCRTIQNQILRTYELDFSKHAPANIVPRIRMLWNAIPAQLAKENKKFIYKLLKDGSRAKDYELALAWLIDAGLVHKVCNVSVPKKPLKLYEEMHHFKLFMLDVGLMGAMANIGANTIVESNLLTEYKGVQSEQFVLQELITKGIQPYYWSADRATAEVDFLIENESSVVPIEVKAAENLKSKSLKVYYTKYAPQLSLRSTFADYKKEEWLTSLPLYCISTIKELQ